MEASDLSGLLSRLAEATRGEARMRIRVEVGRTRVRTATKVIVGVVVVAPSCSSPLVNRDYLAVYDSPGGQVVLAVVGGDRSPLGGWLLTRMAAIDLPERFTARADGDRGQAMTTAGDGRSSARASGGGVLICVRAVLATPDSDRRRARRARPTEVTRSMRLRARRRALRSTGSAASPPDSWRLSASTRRRARRDLELVDRTPERHALDKLLGSVAGLLVPNLAGVRAHHHGDGLPIGLVVLLSFGTAAAGFVLPDFLLRDEAEQRRRAFRHALSSYLDLVNVLLAGGAGIETALYAAADAGDGWGYQTIRSELRRARLTGQSPWDTFADLADASASTNWPSWPPASRSPDPTAPASEHRSPPRPTPSEATRSPRPKPPPRPPPSA